MSDNTQQNDSFKWETRDNVAILTLNRPQALNSFDLEMMEEHRRRLEEFEADDELRVLVYAAEGPSSSGLALMRTPFSVNRLTRLGSSGA